MGIRGKGTAKKPRKGDIVLFTVDATEKSKSYPAIVVDVPPSGWLKLFVIFEDCCNHVNAPRLPRAVEYGAFWDWRESA